MFLARTGAVVVSPAAEQHVRRCQQDSPRPHDEPPDVSVFVAFRAVRTSCQSMLSLIVFCRRKRRNAESACHLLPTIEQDRFSLRTLTSPCHTSAPTCPSRGATTKRPRRLQRMACARA